MLRGALPETAPMFIDAVRLPKSVNITRWEWQGLVKDSFVWIDFISMPQTRGSDYEKARRSIAAFVERSSHFFVLCPTVIRQDHDDMVCDYGSWLQNSENRFELFALLLSRRDRPPPIVVKGAEATPFMISPTAAIPRSPGLGRMACCDRNHVEESAEGVQQPIPCRKDQMASSMLTMLRSLRAYHFGRDDLLEFRVLTAIAPALMSGLPSDGLWPSPRSVTEFITQNQFNKPDEETESGFGPLLFAAISGNVTVARELINSHHVDVKAPVRVGLPKFGMEKGMDALGFAVSLCTQTKVHQMVSFLLASGADPNMVYPVSGATALIGAVVLHNLEGIRALILYAGERLDLEKAAKANNATALLIAGAYGSFAILKLLVEAGANRQHK